MLADSLTTTQSGEFYPDIHLPGTARHELLKFIAAELPRWRDSVVRNPETAETALTSQLSSRLNSAARISTAWSRIQFSVEERDEEEPSRNIDLVPKPCAATIIIEGRVHTEFQPLLPIECKRLPTPKERKNWDEREYVVTEPPSTTGGIQRFKFGHHGKKHKLGAMIGYIQAENPKHWQAQVNKWILELAADRNSGWTASDSLKLTSEDLANKTCVLNSHHERSGDLADIELQHFWIEMN
jgi:hypothetical protein